MTDDEGPLFSIEPRSKRRGNGHNGAAETSADDPAETSTGSNAGIWLWKGDSATQVWSPEAAQGSGPRASAGSGGTRLRAAQGWIGADPVRLVLALATPAVLILGWALAGTLGVFIVLSAGFVLGILRHPLPTASCPRPPSAPPTGAVPQRRLSRLSPDRGHALLGTCQRPALRPRGPSAALPTPRHCPRRAARRRHDR